MAKSIKPGTPNSPDSPNTIDRRLKRLISGDDRALSEWITQVQNDPLAASKDLDQVFKISESNCQAVVIGVTGPPGVGKSTLMNAFLELLKDEPVGVLLVDPSSPYTGGALLGDRLRMDQTIGDKHFVRSLGSRGERGGLCQAVRDMARLMVAAGKKIVFIETVGVGQIESDIFKVADVTMVVLGPQSGDMIQTLKAGLLEIGQLFLVNKSDLPGAKQFSQDLEVLSQAKKVFLTQAIEKKGVQEVWQYLEREIDHWRQEKNKLKQRKEFFFEEVLDGLTQRVTSRAQGLFRSDLKWQKKLDAVIEANQSPYQLIEELSDFLMKKV